jgi:hypothetical protein
MKDWLDLTQIRYPRGNQCEAHNFTTGWQPTKNSECSRRNDSGKRRAIIKIIQYKSEVASCSVTRCTST